MHSSNIVRLDFQNDNAQIIGGRIEPDVGQSHVARDLPDTFVDKFLLRLSFLVSIRLAVLTPHMNKHTLQIAIMLQRRQAQLAADAAVFDAAEWGFEMHAAAGIDGKHAGFHGARHA